MAWYWIVAIILVAWVGLSVLLAGAWSRFASHRSKRERQIIASKLAHPTNYRNLKDESRN